MREAHIIGGASTHFAKRLDVSVKGLVAEVTTKALAEANVSANDVDLVVYGNAMSGLITGQEMIRAQSALSGTELAGKPMLNSENACASGAAAVHTARLGILAGKYQVVLVVGAEKLTHEDKSVSLSALSSGLDIDFQSELMSRYASESSGGAFMMDIYAEITRKYMHSSGATVEDLARVVVKNRAGAAKNPNAQYQVPVSLETVLESRIISDPIRLLMCSPIADGASALVLCSNEWLKASGQGADASVRIAASEMATSIADDAESSPTAQAAARAFADAGVGPEEIQIAEVHDASAPAELIAYEEIGLCAPGEGPRILRDGHASPGGKCPVNVNGGLLGRGHPVGATGCAQILEIYRQMLGTAGGTQIDSSPRWALAENHGGYLHPHPAVAAVTILSKSSQQTQ